MSTTAAITVIVPGFDVGPYVDEALASLRAQTRDDWVAILVDDGSHDDTGDRFARAAADDGRFRLVRLPERRGLGAARNAALALVDTPFLAFLDADDRMTPRALETLAGALDASGSDFAVGAYVRLRPAAGSDSYEAGAVQPWVSRATAPARRATTLHEHPDASGNIVAWSKLSRTGFWREAGLRFTEGRAYEDQVVAQTMYTRARAFDTVPDVVVEWRERADGSSITQAKNTLPVLVDYLAAMSGGIDVLVGAGHRAAVRARTRLILEMDVPPLVRIAAVHGDERYRRALGEFVRDVWAHLGSETAFAAELDADLAAARLW